MDRPPTSEHRSSSAIDESTATSGEIYGIYVQSNSAEGYAGYFTGGVHVNGTLSKAAGSFKIDHPLDPENKYLSHSFVESPDMMNVYNGKVTTDAQGEATVDLPAYFQALNRDFHYQLTTIGSYAPVYITEEIKDNRFKIAGGKPGVKVSWQVTGIRQDAYATAHPIPVEEDKAAFERGRFLNPEVYGKPGALAMLPSPQAAPRKAEPARQPEPPRREADIDPLVRGNAR